MIREFLHKEWIALEPKQCFHRLQKDTSEQAILLSFQLLLFVTLAFILCLDRCLLDLMLDSIARVLRLLSVGALSVLLGDIMAFVLITRFPFPLARFVDFVLREDVFTRVRTGRGVPQAIAGLVRYSLIFIGQTSSA